MQLMSTYTRPSDYKSVVSDYFAGVKAGAGELRKAGVGIGVYRRLLRRAEQVPARLDRGERPRVYQVSTYTPANKPGFRCANTAVESYSRGYDWYLPTLLLRAQSPYD